MDEKLITRHLEAIETDKVRSCKQPVMPVPVLAQEAINLYHWMQHDMKQLITAGLDWEKAMELEERAAFCSYLQAKWMEEKKMGKTVRKLWKEKSPEAFALRKELVHSFKFAYRNIPELKKKVMRIELDKKVPKMIQHLTNLALLGKSNPTPLVSINFDFSLLELAEQMSEEIADLAGAKNADQLMESKSKILRNKAFWYLKELMDEVRCCGKFVFRKDPDRLVGYMNQYRKILKTTSLN